MITKYKNLNLKNGEKLNINFGRSGLKGHAIPPSSIHSIASYLAMFAPALPEYFIDKYSKEGDLVMDPFSGRGTTALRARERNRNFIGSDLNPYALVLSRFKISQVSYKNIINRINQLETQYASWIVSNKHKYRRAKYRELLYFYSPTVLSSLIFLREIIGKNWENNNNTDNAILAFATGIMHGPSRKDGSSIYFSLDMSNSISMAPKYVRKYAIENNLRRPKTSIFKKILNRVNSKFDGNLLHKSFSGYIFKHDATVSNDNIEDNSIDLIITSPPYLSIVNYTNSNWLKLWLLGYDRKNLNDQIILSDKLKIDEYILFITNFLNAVENKLKKNSHICLIVGDVENTKLIEEVWKKIERKVNFDFVEIYYDRGYSQNKKVLNTMNKRKGKATMIEKILVLRRR